MMLEALVGGTTDPEVLAELARGSLGNKLPALREALEGRVARHHRLLVAELLAHLDYLEEAIGRLSGEVAQVMAPFSPLLALLCTIPGVDRRTAEVIVAEIGSTWLASQPPGIWRAGRGCAQAHASRPASTCSGKTRKGSKWLRTTLSQAANAAARSNGPTWPPTTPASRADADTNEPSWRWRTQVLVIAWHLLTSQPAVHRLGRRRLPGASAQPGVQEPAGPPAGAHGPQGHLGAGPSRLTKSPHQGHWARTGTFNLATFAGCVQAARAFGDQVIGEWE